MDIRRFGVEDEEADDRQDSGDDSGTEGAARKVALHLGLTRPARIADEEDGGEIGPADDEDRADQQRQRPSPGGKGVAVAVCGDVAGGDRPDHGSHEERGQQRGDGEDATGGAAAGEAFDRLAEGKAGAAQDDPEGRDRDRHVERRHHRVEGRGEGRPEDDQAEDQPDVVGLPDRGQRALDRRPRPLPALGPAGDQVPEAAAEVGAAEQRVEGHAEPEDRRGDVGEAHASLPARGA